MRALSQPKCRLKHFLEDMSAQPQVASPCGGCTCYRIAEKRAVRLLQPKALLP